MSGSTDPMWLRDARGLPTSHRVSEEAEHPAARRSRRNEIVAYFLLTFAFSWAVQLPLALTSQGVISASPPMALHYLAAFGPLLAALVVTLDSRGIPVRQEWVRQSPWPIP